jgi:hypothetical protein
VDTPPVFSLGFLVSPLVNLATKPRLRPILEKIDLKKALEQDELLVWAKSPLLAQYQDVISAQAV